MKSVFNYLHLFVYLLFLVQCTKKECTDIYAPVCGADGNSYLNACLAQAAGNTAFESGICTMTTPATVRFFGHQNNSKCTWILEIEATHTDFSSYWFTPELPDRLKVDGQKVEVNFVPNDIAFNCLINDQEQLIIYMDLIGIEAD